MSPPTSVARTMSSPSLLHLFHLSYIHLHFTGTVLRLLHTPSVIASMPDLIPLSHSQPQIKTSWRGLLRAFPAFPLFCKSLSLDEALLRCLDLKPRRSNGRRRFIKRPWWQSHRSFRSCLSSDIHSPSLSCNVPWLTGKRMMGIDWCRLQYSMIVLKGPIALHCLSRRLHEDKRLDN